MSAVANDVSSEATVTRIEHEIRSPMAWRSESVMQSDWKVAVSSECIAELDAVLAKLQVEEMPMLALEPQDYDIALSL